MEIVGYMLLFIGIILCLAGDVMFLTVAYKRSLVWFFGCLFVPLVDVIFLCLNFKATAKPLGISVLGFLMACVGSSLCGLEI